MSPHRMTSVAFVQFYFAWRFCISPVDKHQRVSGDLSEVYSAKHDQCVIDPFTSKEISRNLRDKLKSVSRPTQLAAT